MPNAWIEHIKAYQQQHGVSYKESMVKAKASYIVGAGSKSAGYIRRLVAEKNKDFDIDKIQVPSQHLITHFRNEEHYEPNEEHYETNENHYEPNENHYEPPVLKKKKKRTKKGMKEVDIEQIENQKRDIMNTILALEKLKRDREDYNTIVGREATVFYRKRQEIEANKKRYKLEKKNQLLIENANNEAQFRLEKEKDYPDLFLYIKQHKLSKKDSLIEVYRHINEKIKALHDLNKIYSHI